MMFPFPLCHPDERAGADNDNEPINAGPGWEKKVQTEPDREVQDHADDCGGNDGKRGGELCVAAQLLDVTAKTSLPY